MKGVETRTFRPISEKTKKTVYLALGNLQNELYHLELSEEALEVYAIIQRLKVLDEKGELIVYTN